VFEGIDTANDKYVVVKVLKPIKKKKVRFPRLVLSPS